jgi:hypothetical protein
MLKRYQNIMRLTFAVIVGISLILFYSEYRSRSRADIGRLGVRFHEQTIHIDYDGQNRRRLHPGHASACPLITRNHPPGSRAPSGAAEHRRRYRRSV